MRREHKSTMGTLENIQGSLMALTISKPIEPEPGVSVTQYALITVSRNHSTACETGEFAAYFGEQNNWLVPSSAPHLGNSLASSLLFT